MGCAKTRDLHFEFKNTMHKKKQQQPFNAILTKGTDG